MTDETIEILFNGEPKRVAQGATVADVLAAMDDAPAAVATAVDGEFIARSARAGRMLQAGQALFVFQPITGG